MQAGSGDRMVPTIAALQELVVTLPCTTTGTAPTALQENLKAKLELASLAPARFCLFIQSYTFAGLPAVSVIPIFYR